MTRNPSPSSGQRDERTGLLRLAHDECVELLASNEIGRIVFVDDGQPVALPVNYAWFEDSIVFRTGTGQKLAAAALGQRVAFEIDEIDAATRAGVSVLVTGTARTVENWAERERLEQLGVQPWQRLPWRREWVRIDTDKITGRRLDLS